jgi:hypothetical protein
MKGFKWWQGADANKIDPISHDPISYGRLEEKGQKTQIYVKTCDRAHNVKELIQNQKLWLVILLNNGHLYIF